MKVSTKLHGTMPGLECKPVENSLDYWTFSDRMAHLHGSPHDPEVGVKKSL
jgi:hypothetical protein